MKWKKYPKYRDSGIEWLGDIPEGWEVRRFKYSLQYPLQYGANESAEYDIPEWPRYVRITDIDDNGMLRKDTFRSLPKEVAEPYILKDGDLLLARSGATVGKTFLYKKSWGVAAFAGYLIRASINKEQCLPAYAAYFCNSNAYWTWIRSSLIQATIQNVSAEKYGNLRIPFPDILQQTAIAAFLDRETARIDALIEKKERQSELLQEKRAALISHAVTKGLDPNAKMKDSGIEWLGDIPEGWEVKKLKFTSSYNDDSLKENTDEDYELTYVDISSVGANVGIVKTESMLFADAPSRARRKVQHGDTIISTVRTYLRAIASIINPEENLIVSTGFAVIRPKEELISEFAGYALRSIHFVEEVVARSVGVSYPAINASDLVNLVIPMPIKSQQTAIAAFLDRETARIDIMKSKVKDSIEKLIEYRTALISAAVTGKIDVRNEVA